MPFTQEIQNKLNRLINQNGGWFVFGFHHPKKVGEVIFGVAGWPTVVVVGEASDEESLADCEFLGETRKRILPFKYKVAMD